MRKIILLLSVFLVTIDFSVAVNDSLYIISSINLSGNDITHSKIIFRELTFKTGDTLNLTELRKEMVKSEQNLMNISLFNFVSIQHTQANKDIIINIKLTERWYIWPIPVFDLADRNFNTWWKTKDFKRVNYGIDLAIYNFRGRNETLNLLLSLGYDEKYGFIYQIPYINKKQTLGLIIRGNYNRSHEIALKTFQNKVIFFKDIQNYPKQLINLAVGTVYRRNIHNSHSLQLNFESYRFRDTLMKLNPEYSVENKNEIRYFSLSYLFKNDFRDYKPYPLNGHYFDIEINKTGLGILKNENANFLSLKTNIRKYNQLSKRFYVASGLTAMANTTYPYYYQNGLGYIRDYLRGYEYYVISGNGYALLKNNIKYAIIPQRIVKVNALKTEKFNTIPYAFYVNLYADMAYVYNKKEVPLNSLVNQFLIGYGIGIDFVTYYDKVLRVEYSFNKMGEKGIFVHFMTSI